MIHLTTLSQNSDRSNEPSHDRRPHFPPEPSPAYEPPHLHASPVSCAVFGARTLNYAPRAYLPMQI